MSALVLKVRLVHGSCTAMGPGKAELLDAIYATGSISAAAKTMHMSYRRAWELVDTMNRCFDQPLVTTSPGGVGGGGAQVTEFGRLLLKRYKSLVAKTNKLAATELADVVSHLRALD